MTKGIIKGSEFNYIIDTSYGLSSDGYIATGSFEFNFLRKTLFDVEFVWLQAN